MKLRNLIMGIFVSAAVLAGCKEDGPLSNELKIELSSDKLEFDAPVADTKTVTLVSTRDWKVKDADKLPEWIAVNPVSGGATLDGTAVEITVTANTETNRSTSVVFTIGTLQATLAVSQVGEGGEPVGGNGTLESPYSVAEALAVIEGLGADVESQEVYIKGLVSSFKGDVASDISTYGSISYYISDDGTESGTLLVYAGKYFNGEKFTSADQLNVKDEVVILGKLINFKGNTPEVTLGNKIVSLNGQGGGSSGGEVVGTPEGDGSEANPYNVAGALTATQALAADVASEEVYIKGIISSITEIDTDSYGNATYYISDDGTTAGQFMVYRGYYLNGDKFIATDQIKVGDKVLIYGKLINFKGNTPEVNTGSSIISINGQTEDDTKRLSVSPTSINVSASAESATFKVSGNVSWTASVTEGSDWVEILYGESGTGADDVVLSLTKNESEESARTAKITVSTTEDAAVKSYEVVITQAKKAAAGDMIVDVLNRELTGITGLNYTEWNGKTVNSPAVYAGYSAGGNESIQLRSSDSTSGIITTTSGGKVRKVVVTWHSATSSTGNRKLYIYGKSTPYTSTKDLYAIGDDETSGVLLGTIVCGTSTELTIDGDYEFIGMRSISGAMYLSEIQISWE